MTNREGLLAVRNQTPIRRQLQEIDARSKELMKEYFQHCSDAQSNNPDFTDRRKPFESWALQKTAGLQVVAVQITERLEKLEG
jgi:hypothetical protein